MAAWEKHFYVLIQEIMATGAEQEVLAAYGRSQALFGWHPSILEVYQCADLVGRIEGAELGNPTSQTQNRLFSRLSRAAREHRLHGDARHETLRRQMFEFEIDTSGAQPKYGTPGTAVDDAVYSLVWSCEAADGAPISTEKRVREKPKGM